MAPETRQDFASATLLNANTITKHETMILVRTSISSFFW
jgi:hypothetical protein